MNFPIKRSATTVRGEIVSSGEYKPGQIDLMLADECAKYYYDPYGWVLFAFDWGNNELEGFDGPDDWQRDSLKHIGEVSLARGFDGITPVDPNRYAVASGHG